MQSTPISQIRMRAAEPLQHWFQHMREYLSHPAEVLRGYQRQDLWPDLLAGLTVAIVLLPQAIAYALIAELPPQTGLYAAIVAAIVGALWYGSQEIAAGRLTPGEFTSFVGAWLGGWPTLKPSASSDVPSRMSRSSAMPLPLQSGRRAIQPSVPLAV